MLVVQLNLYPFFFTTSPPKESISPQIQMKAEKLEPDEQQQLQGLVWLAEFWLKLAENTVLAELL